MALLVSKVRQHPAGGFLVDTPAHFLLAEPGGQYKVHHRGKDSHGQEIRLGPRVDVGAGFKPAPAGVFSFMSELLYLFQINLT